MPQQFLGIDCPSEERLHVEEGGFLHRGGTGRHNSVGDEDGPVIEKESVAQSRFHAYIRGDSCKKQVTNALRAQLRIQSRAGEAAVPRLHLDEVARLRL